jgi:hypothetical protein
VRAEPGQKEASVNIKGIVMACKDKFFKYNIFIEIAL